MKLILFFSIVLNFSLLNFVSLNNNENKLMLVGFQNYKKDGKKETFSILFKKYNNSYNNYSNANLKLAIYNGTTNEKYINCTESNKLGNDDMIYECENDALIQNSSQIQLQDISITYYNNSDNKVPVQIIDSSFAEIAKNNISSYEKPLDFRTFYFDNYTISSDKKVVINGNMNIASIENTKYKLNLSDTTYNCSISDKNITFNLTDSVNENLIGKMLLDSSDSPKILIFSNGTNDDSLVYFNSTIQDNKASLLGFEQFKNESNQNATSIATFKGTTNNLKKYIKFTTKITYLINSTLSEEKTINVIGERDPDSIDVKKGIIKYNITYPNTDNITIINIDPPETYTFGDDVENGEFEPLNITFIGESLNLTNKDPIEYNFIKTITKPNYSKDSFSLNFDLTDVPNYLNINQKKRVYLNYIPMDNSDKTDEIICTVEKNKTNTFNIVCEPKKDVYTYLKDIKIIVPTISSTRRLRFLQSTGNTSFYVPEDTDEVIDFDYTPEMNIFTRRGTKKRGLSGGAITAIVLATIAAVAAVGITFLILNKSQPANPVKNASDMNLQNSTTNLN